MEYKVLSQKKMMEIFLPLLEEEGAVYRKKTNVFARQAEGGERVETVTGDGKETVNTAAEGDYLVKNQTGAEEIYIVSPEKFRERYAFLREVGGGFDEYRATGKILALELAEETLRRLGLPDPFYFEAPWGEEMIARLDDFLAAPTDKSEVYRIARHEFFETYTGE